MPTDSSNVRNVSEANVFRFVRERPYCRRQDLNLHDLAITRPSTWRVCQFRHSGAAPITIGQSKAELKSQKLPWLAASLSG